MTTTRETAVPEINELEWKLAWARAARAFSKENWCRKGDDRAVAPTLAPQQSKLASAEIRHLSALVGQLAEVRKAEESDEYGVHRATEAAYERACQLLVDAAIDAGNEGRGIPYGCVSTDSEGGIRIEWVRSTTGVHLAVPSAKDQEAYIYHEVGDQYATEPASPEKLAHWLRLIG